MMKTRTILTTVRLQQAQASDFKFIIGRNEYPLSEPGAPELPAHFFAAEGPAASVLALLPSILDGSSDVQDPTLHSRSCWAQAMRLLGDEYEEFASIPASVMHTFNVTIEDLDTQETGSMK